MPFAGIPLLHHSHIAKVFLMDEQRIRATKELFPSITVNCDQSMSLVLVMTKIILISLTHNSFSFFIAVR